MGTGLLDLLSQFIQALFVWLPRPFLVPRYEAYVRWTLGREPYRVYSWGLNIPLIHSHEIIDLRSDSVECEAKVLWTKDGKPVAVGFAFVWRVGDPLVVGQKINGLDAFVAKLAESVLPEFVGTYPLEDFKKRCAGGEGREWGANQLLRARLNALFKEYGIEIAEAFVNFTDDTVRSFRHIMGGNEKGAAFVVTE